MNHFQLNTEILVCHFEVDMSMTECQSFIDKNWNHFEWAISIRCPRCFDYLCLCSFWFPPSHVLWSRHSCGLEKRISSAGGSTHYCLTHTKVPPTEKTLCTQNTVCFLLLISVQVSFQKFILQTYISKKSVILWWKSQVSTFSRVTEDPLLFCKNVIKWDWDYHDIIFSMFPK